MLLKSVPNLVEIQWGLKMTTGRVNLFREFPLKVNDFRRTQNNN
jgi:hypothetical protein